MKNSGFLLTKGFLIKAILVLLTVVITYFWLDFAPDGLLGKMDAVGYAVCHRIDDRSFHLGERALPLCARCSGMQLGALLGLAYQSIWGRRGKFPPMKILIPLGIMALFFVIDGVNSYLNFIPMLPQVYASQNWLRLATGTGLGLGLAAVIFPIFNQTIWRDWEDEYALGNWKQFLGLIGLATLLVLTILSENPLVLYPLAILSGLAVLVVLSMCYSLLVVMILKKDNHFTTWRSVWAHLLAGFSIAITQTFVIDMLRFAFTLTWGGFDL
ncbi:MAG: DUF2085 domain-containing protein [Anaerolineaceae bacterium]|mgnify:CR=1 FL=1|jgi:uncharacterized membrane protein|nr:DUF2085 domain-containing protein [Anaerolineaceae bacterium]